MEKTGAGDRADDYKKGICEEKTVGARREYMQSMRKNKRRENLRRRRGLIIERTVPQSQAAAAKRERHALLSQVDQKGPAFLAAPLNSPAELEGCLFFENALTSKSFNPIFQIYRRYPDCIDKMMDIATRDVAPGVNEAAVLSAAKAVAILCLDKHGYLEDADTNDETTVTRIIYHPRFAKLMNNVLSHPSDEVRERSACAIAHLAEGDTVTAKALHHAKVGAWLLVLYEKGRSANHDFSSGEFQYVFWIAECVAFHSMAPEYAFETLFVIARSGLHHKEPLILEDAIAAVASLCKKYPRYRNCLLERKKDVVAVFLMAINYQDNGRICLNAIRTIRSLVYNCLEDCLDDGTGEYQKARPSALDVFKSLDFNPFEHLRPLINHPIGEIRKIYIDTLGQACAADIQVLIYLAKEGILETIVECANNDGPSSLRDAAVLVLGDVLVSIAHAKLADMKSFVNDRVVKPMVDALAHGSLETKIHMTQAIWAVCNVFPDMIEIWVEFGAQDPLNDISLMSDISENSRFYKLVEQLLVAMDEYTESALLPQNEWQVQENGWGGGSSHNFNF